jgi:hypothetical protein
MAGASPVLRFLRANTRTAVQLRPAGSYDAGERTQAQHRRHSSCNPSRHHASRVRAPIVPSV